MSRARANADATSQTYIENATAAQELSGTYSTERLYFNDSYQLTGDVTVTGHLALGTIADEDVVITQDSTERTITGSGTLEAGNVLHRAEDNTDIANMTGTLANSVQDNVTRLGTVTTGTFNGTLDSTTFSGNAGQITAKAWVRYDQAIPSVTDSFNVSTVTDNTLGEFTINFNITMTNANYAILATSSADRYLSVHSSVFPTTSAVKFVNTHYNGTRYDMINNSIAIFGD